ncbi:hypothetical protein HGRIS_006238 [Hohenbuehelia grisea]|uniref:CFS1-like protein n=1 Tax=Hohenbuehelia grisea TaxID=104357 RepID=A0ABR3JZ88_9AGAR
MSKQLLDTPEKHPFSISGLVDDAWNAVREVVFRTSWSPITRLAESAVVALMANIDSGDLRVLTFSHMYRFPSAPLDSQAVGDGRGDDSKALKAELRVVDDVFWVRLCTMGDLGFAEAYMYGEVECDDLVTLFKIFLNNREKIANLDSKASYLFSLPQKLTSYRFLNNLSNSRSNISAHYDISNDMFAGFLSEDMTYSCAIFEDLDGDLCRGEDQSEWSGGQSLKRIHPHTGNNLISAAEKAASNHTVDKKLRHNQGDELYEAQLRKLRHIIRKAKIKPGHRVLEIGSGWGSMAMLIAKSILDTTVDTLTLSVQQQQLARERIAAAGLSDRIRVHLMDYRSMPAEWEGTFDRVISVEMIEAVGAEFLKKYWSVVDWAMKKRDAVGVVQVITIPELLFPGGFLPTLTYLLETMKEGSSGRLIVDSVSNIGPHYARTLREWRRRFIDRFEEVIVPSLKREYPETMGGARGREEIEVFKRKWIYY